MSEIKEAEYDICIVGSGAGASPVAYTLAKAGAKVLVLEKGPWLTENEFFKDELAISIHDAYNPKLDDEQHVIEEEYTDEEGNSFYLIRVRTDASSIKNSKGEEMPIIPGMLTEVDVITGKRTILEYLLNPLLRAKEAARRER